MKWGTIVAGTTHPNTLAMRLKTACVTSLLPLLLLLALPAAVQAQFAFTTNNGAITITYPSCLSGAVTIPSSTNGLTITSIGDYAFGACRALTSVTIGTNITSIGVEAFVNCTSLASVTIPNSVTSIGEYAFDGCTSLTSVTIPHSVTNIGVQPFEDCTSLTAIMVDTNNPAYSSVDGVLFDKSQTTLIQYPAGLVGTSYTIPNSVTSIGKGAFWVCTSLTNVTIGTSITNIGDFVFTYCTSLASVTIPNSVTSIGDAAFADCESLTSVQIGNGVTNIGFQAFEYCTSLTNVTIGTSVTNIGDFAFDSCNSLTAVYFQGNAPSADATVFSGDNNVTVHYLPGTTGWGTFAQSTGAETAVWPSGVNYTASPTNGLVGLTVQFNCPSVDGGGNTITNWNWNFGDGATNTAQSPTHVYTSVGSFTPVLIAGNNLGTLFPGAGPSITVSPPPAVGVTSSSGTNLVINGSNGFSGITYYVLTSTNLGRPLSQWTPVATNTWSANGNFSLTVTNAVNPSVPKQFYVLQIP